MLFVDLGKLGVTEKYDGIVVWRRFHVITLAEYLQFETIRQ